MLSPTPSSPAHERRFSGKRPRRPLRLDMTALVSVSLLLLIFFVYERTQGALRVVDFHQPPKERGCGIHCGGCGDIHEEKLFTMILGRDKVYSYWRVSTPVVDSFPYDSLKIKLLAHKYRYRNLCEKGLSLADIKASKCWDPIFVVKPRKDCRYGQFMACLNELSRLRMQKYAIDTEYQADSMIIQGQYAMAGYP